MASLHMHYQLTGVIIVNVTEETQQAYFDTPHPYCIAVWESRYEQVRLSCLQINSTEEVFFLHTEEIMKVALLPAETL